MDDSLDRLRAQAVRLGIVKPEDLSAADAKSLPHNEKRLTDRLMRQAGYSVDDTDDQAETEQPKVPRVTTADRGAGHTEPRNVDADMDRRLMRQYRQS